MDIRLTRQITVHHGGKTYELKKGLNSDIPDDVASEPFVQAHVEGAEPVLAKNGTIQQVRQARQKLEHFHDQAMAAIEAAELAYAAAMEAQHSSAAMRPPAPPPVPVSPEELAAKLLGEESFDEDAESGEGDEGEETGGGEEQTQETARARRRRLKRQ